jgi:antitoxin component YwqK of YwqJK toxin-antitoxin module
MKALHLTGLFMIAAIASSYRNEVRISASAPQPDHEVLPPRCYSFVIRKLSLTHSEFISSPHIHEWDPQQRRISVVYGKPMDSVYLYESDTLISTFISKDYRLSGEIRVYDRQGRLASVENFADSVGMYDLAWPSYNIFRGRKHGRCEWFFPDGRLQRLAYYRNGRNDTFEQVFYNSGNLFSYNHKDTWVYYGEDNGIPARKEYFTQRGKYRMYVEYLYWPTGKLRSEKYYFDREKTVPCHTWKDYDKSGKLVKSVRKKGPYITSERMGEPQYFLAQTAACDVKKILTDSTREILKRVSIRSPGTYTLKFSMGSGGGKLLEMEGPVDYNRQLKYALEDILSSCRHCYASPQYSREMQETDYYTLDFVISE